MEGQALQNSYNHVSTQENQEYLTASIVGIRLDTTSLIDKFELFLRGAKWVIYQDDDGHPCRKKMSFGVPRANEDGIESIKNYAEMILNKAVVQGNTSRDDCKEKVLDIIQDLADDMWDNLYKWGVSEYDYLPIIHRLWHSMDLFISRTINNKERESYQNTIIQKESNTIQEQNKGWGFFKRS